MTDLKLGRLTVIGFDKSQNNKSYWACICDCGNNTIVRGDQLRNGHTKSCGCLLIESRKTRAKHGLSKSKLYKVWIEMNRRCSYVKSNSYLDYGGRGISVCDEWADEDNGFVNFKNWCFSNGYNEGLQIDRTNNNGDYKPSNCRFVSNRVNSLNTRKRKTNKSGYTGVSFSKRTSKWESYITIFGKKNNLGLFENKKDALDARNNFIIKNNIELEYKVQTL